MPPSSKKSPPPPSQFPPHLAAQLAAAADIPPPPNEAARYRFRPEAFLQEQLGIKLYDGFSLDWVRDIAVGWLHGHARQAHARGQDPVQACRSVRPDLPVWEPGMPVVNTFVLQGGAGLGKSVVVAGLLLWAARVSRSFTGVVYAPFVDQAYRTTWRYVDAFLTGGWSGCDSSKFSDFLEARKGREKDPAIELSALRSISTKAVNQGSARVQGQHVIVGDRPDSASVHVFEEADGIDDPGVFDAVKTMVGKGVALWLLCLNPATPTAPVQDLRGPTVKRYELSVLDHPNVVQGRDVIPGASNREWVEGKLGDWAEEVSEHDPRAGTFELPWIHGKIYKPLPPWWWRVVGVVPPTGGGDSAVSEALYLTACSRNASTTWEASDPTRGTLGVDVAQSDAGHGDSGAIARFWRGCVQVVDRVHQKDSRLYGFKLVERLTEMARGGCREVEVRIDNGGGFGRDVYNQIADHDVGNLFDVYRVVLKDFGGASPEPRRYKNWITWAYCSVERALQEGVALVDPPKELRQDWCGRKLRWGTVMLNGGSVDVVYLQAKKEFREARGRSPDDGDAGALAMAPWSGPVGGFEAFDGRRWGGSASAREGAGQDEGSKKRDVTTDDLLLGRAPGEGGGFDDGDLFAEAVRWRR